MEAIIMNKLLTSLILMASLLVGPVVSAAGVATKEEAQAMAVKAAEYLTANGAEKAFLAFEAKDGPWHDRDLYVMVLDAKGVLRAHGNNAGLTGKSMLALKDVDGKPFIQSIVDVSDRGWIDYKWQNPVTKAVEPKTSYEIRVGEYVVGVGAYVQ